MKTVYFFLTFCLWGLTSTAQYRYADLKLTFASPPKDSTIHSPAIIKFSIQVLNQGPDTVFTTDTLIYEPSHSLNPHKKERRVAFQRVLAPNDSFLIWDTISVNSGKHLNKFGMSLGNPRAFGEDYGKQRLQSEFSEDRHDNTPALFLNHIGNSSTPLNPGIDPSIQVFPNPANNFITIVASGIKNVQLYDILGRELDFKTLEANAEHRSILVDQPNGIYFIAVELHAFIITRKILIR